MRALPGAGISMISASALMSASLTVGGWQLAVCQPPTANSELSVVVLVLLLLVEGRIFERHFFAGFEAFDDLHPAVVGEAGDHDPLLEELLPGVFVLLAVAGGL